MIRLPSLRNLTREDFPGQAGWIEPLVRAVNGIADAVRSLASSIPLSAVLTVDLDIPSTYANAFPKMVANPLGQKASHLWCTGIIVRTSPNSTVTDSTKAVFVEWENYTDSKGKQMLRLKNVSGLSASTNYRLTCKVEA